MKEITDKKKCTGCSACYNICPKSCISMHKDEEGFLRPEVDSSLCINCNLCEKICPANSSQEKKKIIQSFGANAKNIELRKVSSSGGLFSLMAQYVIEAGGIVFGAVFSEDYQSVKHTYIDKTEDIYKIRMSKYVQSVIGDTYSLVKHFLLADKKVLFCGTPCQIAGLKSFLRKEYNNLITLDFICHGVPSPRIWDSYIVYRKKQLGGEIQQVSFRNKQTGWRHYSLRIDVTGGNYYSSPVSKDMYLRGFVNNLLLRPSCYQCDFKAGRSRSDITLADFWSVDSVAPELNDDSGMSLLLIHTNTGQKLLSEICNDVNIIEITEEQALMHNTSYQESVSMPKNRNKFFCYAKKKGDVRALKKYTRTTMIIRLKVMVSEVVRIASRERGVIRNEKS